MLLIALVFFLMLWTQPRGEPHAVAMALAVIDVGEPIHKCTCYPNLTEGALNLLQNFRRLTPGDNYSAFRLPHTSVSRSGAVKLPFEFIQVLLHSSWPVLVSPNKDIVN